jgi:hypothetical protein
MRIVKGAAALGCAILAVPAGAIASQAEVEALGAAHAAEHEALARYAATAGARGSRPRPYTRAKQRALAAQSGSPGTVGRWDVAPFPIPNFAIHATLLPTGKVLTWGYPPKLLLDYRPNFGQASVWNPQAGTGAEAFKDVPPPLLGDGSEPASIYCSGQTLLADGTVLLTGGNKRFPANSSQSYTGLDKIFTFDPWTETWHQQPDMRHGRWYPSQVQLADNTTVIVGGYDETEPGGKDTFDVELFHPPSSPEAQGSVELKESASRQTALYPHLFLMPDGNVLMGGPGSGDSAILNTDKFTWRDLPRTSEDRIGGNAVLHLADSRGPTRITQIGGYDYIDANASSPARNTTETLSYADPGAGWSNDAPLNVGRSYGNTVLLPDGSMVLVGGGRGKYPNENDNYAIHEDGSARAVELWDPETNQWTLGPPQAEDRGYHSTALLLPDGRVLSAGDDMHPNEDSDTAEIYSPPYLFREGQPEVTQVPTAMPWGKQFAVHTNADVDEVVLMAPGATTHGADMTQRRIPLRITQRVSGKGVNAVTPDSPELAPPGFYMLFVIDARGVPSVARWVRLGHDAPSPPIFDDKPPKPKLSLKRVSVKKLARGANVVITLKANEALTGRLTARLWVSPRNGRGFYTPLGFRSGQLLADGERSRKLSFALSRSQRKQMRRAKRVKVRAKLTVRDGGNNRATAQLRRTFR